METKTDTKQLARARLNKFVYLFRIKVLYQLKKKQSNISARNNKIIMNEKKIFEENSENCKKKKKFLLQKNRFNFLAEDYN